MSDEDPKPTPIKHRKYERRALRVRRSSYTRIVEATHALKRLKRRLRRKANKNGRKKKG